MLPHLRSARTCARVYYRGTSLAGGVVCGDRLDDGARGVTKVHHIWRLFWRSTHAGRGLAQQQLSFATCSTDKMIYVCKLGEAQPQKVFKGHKRRGQRHQVGPHRCGSARQPSFYDMPSAHSSLP